MMSRISNSILRLKKFIFNRGVAVTSPRSGTGAAKRGLPACSARAFALAAVGRLPAIHWENALVLRPLARVFPQQVNVHNAEERVDHDKRRQGKPY